MAATLIDDLLGQLDRFTKLAQERESENITGQDPDSMPGAENDKPIPAGATKDDPKVKDDTINNTDARNLDGAKPGSDAPVVEQGLEASESVLNPDKKPLDTADANAKEASALGNNLIKTILETKQAAQKQAAAPAVKATEAQTQKQAAPADKISVDMAMLAKIAAITLADEEGQLAVQSALTKRAGAEFAAEVLDTLEKRAAEAEFEKGAQDAEAMIGDAQEAQGAADAEEALGAAEEAQGAADAEEALGAAEEAQGAADAEAALGGDAEDGAGDELDEGASLDDFSPEEVAEAVQEMAQDGQISPEDAQAVIEAVQEQAAEQGEADDLSEEELAEQLQAAVDNGQLTEEDLQNVIQELSEGGADEGAVNELAGDVGAEGGDAGVDPTEAEEPADEGEKAASAKKKASAINPLVGKLIEAIKAAK